MMAPHTLASGLRSSLLLLFVGFLFGGLPSPASAQSVASVVDDMQSRYEQQMETVETFIVETNLYTSYNKRVIQDGTPTYRTRTQRNDRGREVFASSGAPSITHNLPFEGLRKHAVYAGTETIDGVRCHVLQVDDPSNVNPEMGEDNAESMTYYIDSERHVPVRMVVKQKAQNSRGPAPSGITLNMKNHQTTDGLTLPHRMELQFETTMSEQQRRQMQKMVQKMKNLPEQQREQMEKRMDEQMVTMRQIMSGDPVVIEVQDVRVNVDLPEGTF